MPNLNNYELTSTNFIDLLNSIRDSFTVDFNVGDDLKTILGKQDIFPINDATHDNHSGVSFSTGFFGPWGGSGYYGDGSSDDNSNSWKNIFMPILLGATATATGGYVIEGTAGAAVKAATATVVRTGASFVSHPAVILAALGLAAYGATWEIADQIDLYLKQVNFDWGPNSTETQVVTYLVDTGLGVKTYIEYDLIQRLLDALKDWGLWEEAPAVEPITPVINQAQRYNFENHFPPIPNDICASVQRLIDAYNITINNRYVIVSRASDGNIYLSVFSSNSINVKERSSKTNTDGIFTENEITRVIGRGYDDLYLYQWEISPDGSMREVNSGQDASIPITMRSGSDASVSWDNFGSSYRLISSNTIIGPNVEERDRGIVLDPQAIPIPAGAIDDPSYLFPDWWRDRILVSMPKVNSWIDGQIADADINNKEVAVPLDIGIKGHTQGATGVQAAVIAPAAVTDTEMKEITVPIPKIIDEEIGQDSQGGHSTPKPPNPDPINFPDIPDIGEASSVCASEMITIYNPTKAQLSNLARGLWSNDWSEVIGKMFMDPMQCLIGLHLIFATPSTSGNNEIILGTWGSGVRADVITNQFKTFNCGTIKLNEFFGNAHDYISTSIQLFLPFIGFVDLSVPEVMGKYINVKYSVDFLTGTCLAYVRLSKNGTNFYTAYTFNGNCAVQLPLTGANYTQTMASMLTFGASVATGAATGGVAGALIGGLAGLGSLVGNSQAQVTRSGSIAGNAGAMGYKKPYLLINRNVPHDASNKGRLEGLPQYANVRLSKLSGFTRVKHINLDDLTCSEIEKDKIRAKLMEGIIL